MGMFFYNINYNGNPKKPVLPKGARLNYNGGTSLPYDYIDLKNLDDVAGMDYMFADSEYTQLPPLSDTSRFREFVATFQNTKIMTAPAIDTSGAYKFDSMFSLCASLVTIPRLNISGCTDPMNLQYIFNGCYLLETVGWEGDIKASLSIEDSPVLSDATILSTCYNLFDGAVQDLRLNSALSAKASQNIKLNATADGLEFCDAADPDTIGTLNDYVTAKGWNLYFS